MEKTEGGMGTVERLFYIDTSELDETINTMKHVLEPEQFDRFIYRTLKETGDKAKSIVPKEVQAKYEVTQTWVRESMGKPKLSAGDGVQCVIPIDGHRGSIGGTFKAKGGKRRKIGRGKDKGKRKGKAMPLVANIVKGQSSELPEEMKHQGGQPPFMNGKVAFTRKTKARYPIVSVVGLGVPQMPLNKAKPKIQEEIVKYMEGRLEHNFQFLFGK